MQPLHDAPLALLRAGQTVRTADLAGLVDDSGRVAEAARSLSRSLQERLQGEHPATEGGDAPAGVSVSERHEGGPGLHDH